MNIREFKAWLEGFEEAMEGKPTQAQWKKIKAKISEVEDNPTREYHYWRPLYPYWSYDTAVDPYYRGNIVYCGNDTKTYTVGDGRTLSGGSGVAVSGLAFVGNNAPISWYEQGRQDAAA